MYDIHDARLSRATDRYDQSFNSAVYQCLCGAAHNACPKHDSYDNGRYWFSCSSCGRINRVLIEPPPNVVQKLTDKSQGD